MLEAVVHGKDHLAGCFSMGFNGNICEIWWKKQVEDLIRCKPQRYHTETWSAWLLFLKSHHVGEEDQWSKGDHWTGKARFDSHHPINTGWWCNNPSEKYESMGRIILIPYMKWKNMFETTSQNISSMILMKLTAANALRYEKNELKPFFSLNKEIVDLFR